LCRHKGQVKGQWVIKDSDEARDKNRTEGIDVTQASKQQFSHPLKLSTGRVIEIGSAIIPFGWNGTQSAKAPATMPNATSRAPEALPPRMLWAARAPLLPVGLVEGAEEPPVLAGAVGDAELVNPKPVFEVDSAGLVERGVPDEAAEPDPDALVADADLDDGTELAPVTVVDKVADSAPMAKSLLTVYTVLTSLMATNSMV